MQLFVRILEYTLHTTYFHVTYHCQILLNISDISYSGFTLTNAMPNIYTRLLVIVICSGIAIYLLKPDLQI